METDPACSRRTNENRAEDRWSGCDAAARPLRGTGPTLHLARRPADIEAIRAPRALGLSHDDRYNRYRATRPANRQVA